MIQDTRVYLSSCPEYTDDILESIILEQFEELGFLSEITPNCKVMLKPNLLMRRKPEEATTTHPSVVGAVVRALKRCGAGEITLAESPGGPYTSAWLRPIYKGTGMSQLDNIVLNESTGTRMVENPQGQVCKRFEIINPYFETDLLINIPKLKTHGMTGLSAAVKNLFGLVPGLKKPEMHLQYPDKNDFAKMLVDLCETARPDFTLMDAVWCMEGDGPSGGSPRHMGAVIGGRNPFALDIVCCELIGAKPIDIPMVSESLRREYTSTIEGITLLGTPAEQLAIKNFKKARSAGTGATGFIPTFLRKLTGNLFHPKPVITDACVGCGRCAECCPRHIIDIQNKRAVIDYADCIRCYCCHEMCPYRAIDFK